MNHEKTYKIETKKEQKKTSWLDKRCY